MPKAGGAARTEALTEAAVVSVHVHGADLFWAGSDGAMGGRTAGGAVVEYRGAEPGRRPIEVTHDGRRLLWSDCAGEGCRIHAYADGVTSTLDVGCIPRDLAGDGRNTYFICGGRLLRYLAPAGGRPGASGVGDRSRPGQELLAEPGRA